MPPLSDIPRDLPPAGKAELFIMASSEAEKLPLDVFASLFPARLARARRYVKPADMLMSIAAGALMAYAPGLKESDLTLGPHGKPAPSGEDVPRFSVSHSGGFTVLAMDTSAVGCDIERIAPFSRLVAKRVFTGAELNWMDAADSSAPAGSVSTAPADGTAIPAPAAPDTADAKNLSRFYTLWTLKESVMKLDGRGFSLPPESFDVLPLLGGGALMADCGTIYGHTQILGDCALSVTCLHPLRDVPVTAVTAAMALARMRTLL